MEEKIKDKVWIIEINKHKDIESKYSFRKDGIIISEHEIIGISSYKICINNDYFSTFYYKKEKGDRRSSHENYLNDVEVCIRTHGILDHGIFIKLYSTKKPTKRTLNKMVAKASLEIDKKYGFLFSGIKEELYNMVELFNPIQTTTKR